MAVCADDNRIMPPHVDAELAKAEGWWFKPENLFNELNINSAIACPAHEETVALVPGNEFYTVQGYAYTGGGRKVTRVELSYDCGSTWHLCEVVWPELEHSSRAHSLGGNDCATSLLIAHALGHAALGRRATLSTPEGRCTR